MHHVQLADIELDGFNLLWTMLCHKIIKIFLSTSNRNNKTAICDKTFSQTTANTCRYAVSILASASAFIAY